MFICLPWHSLVEVTITHITYSVPKLQQQRIHWYATGGIGISAVRYYADLSYFFTMSNKLIDWLIKCMTQVSVKMSEHTVCELVNHTKTYIYRAKNKAYGNAIHQCHQHTGILHRTRTSAQYTFRPHIGTRPPCTSFQDQLLQLPRTQNSNEKMQHEQQNQEKRVKFVSAEIYLCQCLKMFII